MTEQQNVREVICALGKGKVEKLKGDGKCRDGAGDSKQDGGDRPH